MKQYQTLQDLIVFNTKWQITFLANIKQQKNSQIANNSIKKSRYFIFKNEIFKNY